MSVNDFVDVRTTEDGDALWNKPEVVEEITQIMPNMFASRLMAMNFAGGRGMSIKDFRIMQEVSYPWPTHVTFPQAIPASTTPVTVAINDSTFLAEGDRLYVPGQHVPLIIDADPDEDDEITLRRVPVAIPAYKIALTTATITGEPNPRVRSISRGTDHAFSNVSKIIQSWADTPEREWRQTWGIPEKTRLAAQFSQQNLLRRNRYLTLAFKNDKRDDVTTDEWETDGLWPHMINTGYSYIGGLCPMSVLFSAIRQKQVINGGKPCIIVMGYNLLAKLPLQILLGATSDRIANSRKNPQLGYQLPTEIDLPTDSGGTIKIRTDYIFDEPGMQNSVMGLFPGTIRSLKFGVDMWDHDCADPGVGINKEQFWLYEGWQYDNPAGAGFAFDGVTGWIEG